MKKRTLIRRPLTPVDKMFLDGARAYTPGAIHRSGTHARTEDESKNHRGSTRAPSEDEPPVPLREGTSHDQPPSSSREEDDREEPPVLTE